MRELWEDTWFGTGDFDGNEYQHPLIYPHPITKEPAMVFHLGMGKCWGLYQEEQMVQPPGARRMLDMDAMYSLLNDLSIRLFDPSRMLAVDWKKGDVAFLDNRAVAHLASPESQQDPNVVGLRILHRVTVCCDQAPCKNKTLVSP